jgi:hypothetical protein
MEGLAAVVGLFATALLFGGMVFFSFIVAPNVFRALEARHASAFLRRLFPVFYVFGAGMAAAAAIALAPLAWEAALVMALVASGFVFSRQGLMPRINAYRDAELAGDASARQPFARLHRLSVVINLAQMVLVATVLVGFAVRAW